MHNKVKDTQRVFRKILDSLSRPGKIVSLETNFEYKTILLDETMDILMTLLDGEVTFHLVGGNPGATEEIEIRTLSHNVALEKADYIIIPQSADSDAVSAVFQAANKGTLLDPNRNATLIIGDGSDHGRSVLHLDRSGSEGQSNGFHHRCRKLACSPERCGR